MNGSGKVALALTQKEVSYLKSGLDEVKSDVKEIKDSLVKLSKVEERNSVKITYTWKVGGFIIALITTIATAYAAFY